ncbi:MAG: ABC transporter permease [Anaerolineales bacterium]
MADTDIKLKNIEPSPILPGGDNEEMQLDDSRRVRVLSPGMLVFRRFIRNRLAVIGFVILLSMFIFAFVGPVFSPFGQTEVFMKMDSISKDYAGAIRNEELRYTAADGEIFGDTERAAFLLALGKDIDHFNVEENAFRYTEEGEGVYRIIGLELVAKEFLGDLITTSGAEVSEDFRSAYQSAVVNGSKSFEVDGKTYAFIKAKKEVLIYSERNVALALINIYDAYNEADHDRVQAFDFKLASSQAIAQQERIFSVGDQNYSIDYDEGSSTIVDSSGEEFAEVSSIIVNPVDQSIFLPVGFKSIARRTILDRESKFTYPNEDGEELEYTIHLINANYYIRTQTTTQLINMFEDPSQIHVLGTDNNGMDVITRLMYGGRVSLMVGFVVIFIEVFIGIIVGGISGFFGGAVDTALMRFVDLFNSIPFWPIVLIFGSVMDALEVEPLSRIFLLMLVLGLLGWTSVARVVRGQILSLREQDFMVATEATGIRTSRRIFRHLIPNVAPLLIVNATAGLGGIIITEATLGFLGLGVKYPLASWGSIINVASDAFVMTNYWYMWIPAGLLILVTVLGFNFVGDGLRDAYDPKMNR